MKRFVENERGSGVILAIFSFAIVGIMLILVLNIAMAFTKKEQASIAAEHASLAATGVLYDEVYQDVKNYKKLIDVDEDEGTVEILKTIKEKVEDKEEQIKSSDQSLSNNEARIQAIDEVLSSEIRSDSIFSNLVSNAVLNAQNDISNEVLDIIRKNHGKDAANDFDWDYKDYRIVVEAQTEFEPVHHNGISYGSKDDIAQLGTGPEISFLEALGW